MAVRTKLGFRAQPMVNANSVFLRLFQDANHLSVQSSVSEAFVRSKLCYRLVALHSDFDWLIIARSEFWQVGGVDGESDGSGDAGLSCDEAGFFER